MMHIQQGEHVSTVDNGSDSHIRYAHCHMHYVQQFAQQRWQLACHPTTCWQVQAAFGMSERTTYKVRERELSPQRHCSVANAKLQRRVDDGNAPGGQTQQMNAVRLLFACR